VLPVVSIKHEGNTPPGKPRRRREDNVETDLKDTGFLEVKLTDDSCEYGNEHSGSIKFVDISD
jgi:hypothetical protein